MGKGNVNAKRREIFCDKPRNTRKLFRVIFPHFAFYRVHVPSFRGFPCPPCPVTLPPGYCDFSNNRGDIGGEQIEGIGRGDIGHAEQRGIETQIRL